MRQDVRLVLRQRTGASTIHAAMTSEPAGLSVDL
jgi:hypothetical protein